MKATHEPGSRLVRNLSSRSTEQYDSTSRIRHTIQCPKYSPNDFSRPFVRACGCVHRFLPSSEQNKSLSGYNRRSRSCTPMQTHVKSETEKTKIQSKNSETLIRHTSENNLHFKQVMEIKEKLELAPQFQEKYRYQSWRKTLPQRYKTTIFIDLDTSQKKYVEEISLQIPPMSYYESKESTVPVIGTIETVIKHTLMANDNVIDKSTDETE